MTTDAPILLDISDHIARVTLNRPQKRNAVDATMCAAITQAFDTIEADPNVRVTVLSGKGPVFCSGMDLRAYQQGQSDQILFGQYGFAGFVKRRRQKPVIAAVHGAALAGGFEIMLACDLAVASENAVFGLPEAKLGLIAGGGGAFRLAQRMPRVLANEMLLSGRSVSAQVMQQYGMLNHVTSDGEVIDKAHEIATDIAKNAPLSLASSLALSDQSCAVSEPDLWAQSDAALSQLGQSHDVQEGISAFLEKRAPKWQGS